MKKGQESKAIRLPAELYGRIEKRVEATDFSSVEQYIAFVLEEILKEDEEEQTVSKEGEEEVKKRLKALGYLD